MFVVVTGAANIYLDALSRRVYAFRHGAPWHRWPPFLHASALQTIPAPCHSISRKNRWDGSLKLSVGCDRHAHKGRHNEPVPAESTTAPHYGAVSQPKNARHERKAGSRTHVQRTAAAPTGQRKRARAQGIRTDSWHAPHEHRAAWCASSVELFAQSRPPRVV